ncbi:MAG: ankyrin repeat domain-containing protein [Desulfomonile tiedjei]|uniref:Ankyrin repeat domain-containing protein n=1 Tax=Desulfomonile tiedjei TaxID=2358 RepID=A0A9D6V4J4_9BACT|nr:ankyrin repeat domain-containing protein [Desulfomonile tiedjei]
MGRRAIDVGDFVKDVRAGTSCSDLMNKYGLAERVLYEILQELVKMKRLAQSDLPTDFSSPSAPDLELASTCKRCGSLLLADSGECTNCLAERVGQLIDEKQKLTKTNTGELGGPKPVAVRSDAVADEDAVCDTDHESHSETPKEKRSVPRTLHRTKRPAWPALLGGAFFAVLVVAAILLYTEAIELPSGPWRAGSVPPPAEKAVALPLQEIVPKDPAAQERTDSATELHVEGRRRDLETQVLIAERSAEQKRDSKEKAPSQPIEQQNHGRDIKPFGEQVTPHVSDKSAAESAIKAANVPTLATIGENGILTDTGKPDQIAARNSEVTPPDPNETAESLPPAPTSEAPEEEEVPSSKDAVKADLPAAVKDGNIAQVNFLLDGGMDVDSLDENGSSLLLIATASGNEPLIDLLLRRGADAGLRDNSGFTALARACEKGNVRSVNLILRHDKRRGTAELLEACEKGKIKWVRLMVDQGADLNAKNAMGATPLMVAAGKGHLELVTLLLNKGADPGAKDSKGFTALGWAFSPLSVDTAPFPVRREIIRLLKQYSKGKVRDPLAH